MSRELLAVAAKFLIFFLFISPLQAQGSLSPLDEIFRLKKLVGQLMARGNLREAIPIEERIFKLRLSVFPASDPEIGKSYFDLAFLKAETGRKEEAEKLYEKALKIKEASLEPDALEIGVTLNNLAYVKMLRGKPDEARSLFVRALPIQRKRGNHRDLGSLLNNISFLQQDPRKAIEYLEEAVSVLEKAKALDSYGGLATLASLGARYFDQQDWRRAASNYRRAIAIVIQAETADLGAYTGELLLERTNSIESYRFLFARLIAALGKGQAGSEDVIGEGFEIAQWANIGQASRSLALMSVRAAAPNPALQAIVRKRQDLTSEWQL